MCFSSSKSFKNRKFDPKQHLPSRKKKILAYDFVMPENMRQIPIIESGLNTNLI